MQVPQGPVRKQWGGWASGSQPPPPPNSSQGPRPRGPREPAGAYLGLADGAVQGVVLLVVEQAEVQRAQGSCGQGARVTHWPHSGGASSTPGWWDQVPTVTAIDQEPTASNLSTQPLSPISPRKRAMSSSHSRGQRSRGSVRLRQPRSPRVAAQESNPGGRPHSPDPRAVVLGLGLVRRWAQCAQGTGHSAKGSCPPAVLVQLPVLALCVSFSHP